jgi:hypothetical protein
MGFARERAEYDVITLPTTPKYFLISSGAPNILALGFKAFITLLFNFHGVTPKRTKFKSV